MNRFWLKYLIYVLIAAGGYILSLDGWTSYLGIIPLALGYALLDKAIDE